MPEDTQGASDDHAALLAALHTLVEQWRNDAKATQPFAAAAARAKSSIAERYWGEIEMRERCAAELDALVGSSLRPQEDRTVPQAAGHLEAIAEWLVRANYPDEAAYTRAIAATLRQDSPRQEG